MRSSRPRRRGDGRSAPPPSSVSRGPFSTQRHRRGPTAAEADPRRGRTSLSGSVTTLAAGVVARCHRCISADRSGTLAPSPAAPRNGGEAGGGGALGRPSPPHPPSVRRVGGGGGGLAWGSCGRSGRHALGRAAGASCVQRLDDSRNSAIHTTYRISLRSSSLQEPRYPLLRVVCLQYVRPPEGATSVQDLI